MPLEGERSRAFYQSLSYHLELLVRIIDSDFKEMSKFVAQGSPLTNGQYRTVVWGLSVYRDDNTRYALIGREFGAWLGTSSSREVERLARTAVKHLMHSIHDQLNTAEGQRKWQWVLTVES
ncbi:hypothetical protein BDV12DRAFT_204505 [Aspergillus spectabilis]